MADKPALENLPVDRSENGLTEDHDQSRIYDDLIPAMKDYSKVARERFTPPTLTDKERVDLQRISQLQILILENLDILIPDQKAREAFKQRINSELAVDDPLKSGSEYLTKPKFDGATREGFDLLTKFYAQAAIPHKVAELAANNLSLPTGLDVRIIGSTTDVIKTQEQFRQELVQGKADLQIKLPDSGSKADMVSEQIAKLRKVSDWLKSADATIHNKRTDMMEEFLANKLEKGIQQGRYPESWRRPAGMDKETWCAAFENTEGVYARAINIAEALNHLKRSNKGFATDAFENLPPGMTISHKEKGAIDVKFGPLLIANMSLESAVNKPKIAAIQQWSDKYLEQAMQVAAEAGKDLTQIASFGEVEIANGQVNPKTHQFKTDGVPAEGFEPFNLISFDMSINEKKDGFGQVRGIEVTTHNKFEKIPPYGYLNTLGTTVDQIDSKPKTYKLDDYIAVQTGMNRVELIQAKDLAEWKAWQQVKHYGAKGIVLTMDVAMIASGGVEFAAARQAIRMGSREAISIGGRTLAGEAAQTIPREILQKQMAKGAFHVVLGGTGVFHNAGGSENAALNALSTARSCYFLGQAGRAVFNMTGIPKLVGVVEEASVVGKATQAARSSSIDQLGGGWKGLEKTAGKAFSYSDKAFLVQFMAEQTQAVMLLKRHPSNAALDKGIDATIKAASGDTKAMGQLYREDPLRSLIIKDHLEQYRKTMGNLSEADKKRTDEIIEKVSDLSKPEVTKEKRQEYLNELLSCFRYSGAKMSEKQNGRTDEISEAELNANATKDNSLASPAVREMAALAMALLGKSEDGTLPQTVAKRAENVIYTKVSYDENGGKHQQIVGPKQIEQTITSEEVLRYLTPQIGDVKNGGISLGRASALRDVGLLSTEAYGSMLVASLKKDGPTEEKLESIAHLLGAINRLKLEEALRQHMPQDHQYVAKGLAAGTASADLMGQLRQVAESSKESKVSATAQFAYDFLSKNSIDEVDKRRYQEVFGSANLGLSSEKEVQWRRQDLESAGDSAASEERRVEAAERVLRMSIKANDSEHVAKHVGILIECLDSKQSAVADRALSILMEEDSDSGLTLLARLEKSRSIGVTQYKKMKAALEDLICRTDTSGSTDSAIDDAILRVHAIQAAKQFFANETPLNKNVFCGMLCQALSANNQFAEVKVEALKALTAFASPGDKSVIDTIKPLLSPAGEKSEAVRLQAIKAIETLVPTASERKSILAPLATTEPNVAARELLQRYHIASGSIADRSSQLSREAVDRIRTGQNRPGIIEANLLAGLQTDSDFKLLLKQSNILDYIDKDNTLCLRYLDKEPHVRLVDAWAVSREKGDWKSCIGWELDAQNAALKQFEQRVGRLADKTRTGGTDRTIELGDKNGSLKVSERERAALYMGYLVKNGSQMGDPFFKHMNDGGKYSAAEIDRIRNRTANWQMGRTGKFPGVPDSDPWFTAEYKIAHQLKELCVKHDGQIREDILRSTILDALTVDRQTTEIGAVAVATKGSRASDYARVQLIDGLDALLSRPDCSPEMKRDTVKALGAVLGDIKSDQLPLTTVATIRLREKFGPTSFERFDPEWAKVRNSIKSHAAADFQKGEAENIRTPAHVKTVAQESLETNWGSVNKLWDRMPMADRRMTPAELADLLPKNLSALEKKSSNAVGHDETVHTGIEQIFQATKGIPFKGNNDPRLTVMYDLLDSKYEDAVRLAAAAVLGETQTVFGIAANTSDKAVQLDCVRLLARYRADVTVPENALLEQATNLRATLEKVSGKAIEGDPFAFALKYLSDQPADEIAVKVVRQQLHKYGDAAAAAGIALANAATTDAQGLKRANEFFQKAFQAFEINPKAFSELASPKAGTYNSRDLTSAAHTEASRLVGLHQNSGDVPLMAIALAQYAKLQIRMNPSDQTAVPRATQSLKLADLLGEYCYQPQSAERSEQVDEIVQTLKLSPSTRGLSVSGSALMFQAHSRAQEHLKMLEAERLAHPYEKELGIKIASARVEMATLGVDRLVYDAKLCRQLRKDSKEPEALDAHIRQLSAIVQAEIGKLDPSAKFESAHLKFHVAFAKSLCLQGDEQQAAIKQAGELLSQAMELAAKDFGDNSRQYKYLAAKSAELKAQTISKKAA